MKTSVQALVLPALFLMGIFVSTEGKADPKLSPTQTLFKGGDNNVKVFRIPALIRAKNGDLIVLADARHVNGQDLNGSKPIDIAIRRSKDQGKTWTPMQLVYDFPDGMSASDPSILLDRQTGSLFCFYNVWDYKNRPGVYQHYVQESKDNGRTWGKPRNLTQALRRKEWNDKSFVFIPSGNGTQLRNGMLLHTMTHVGHTISLFGSTDHGRTWKPIGNPTKPGDECKVIELKDGSWMINTRVNNQKLRWVHISKDHGKTWTSRQEPALVDACCNAAITRLGKYLLFVNANSTSGRKNLTLKASRDEGKTWSKGFVIEPGMAAYSDITVINNKKVGIFFEADNYRTMKFLTITF